MSSEIKRIRNSFTGVDFHSFPWLLKCHRVSWFECKVAQLAPIMLNVKTCEDSFLYQPRDRLQNTNTPLYCRPTSSPLTTVDPLPDLGKTVAEKMLQILSQKIQLSTSSSNFLKLFFRLISPRLLLQSRLFWAYQAEWFCCCWLYIGATMSLTSGTPLGNWHVCHVIIFVCV